MNPKLLFVIENPAGPDKPDGKRGLMYRMPQVQSFTRETTCYCYYGMPYRKDTDFFHNFPHGLGLVDRKDHRDACPMGGRREDHVPCNSQYTTKEQRIKVPRELTKTIIKSFLELYDDSL